MRVVAAMGDSFSLARGSSGPLWTTTYIQLLKTCDGSIFHVLQLLFDLFGILPQIGPFPQRLLDEVILQRRLEQPDVEGTGNIPDNVDTMGNIG